MATKKKELLEQENSAPETTVPVENTPPTDETQADMAAPSDGGDLNELLASMDQTDEDAAPMADGGALPELTESEVFGTVAADTAAADALPARTTPLFWQRALTVMMAKIPLLFPLMIVRPMSPMSLFLKRLRNRNRPSPNGPPAGKRPRRPKVWSRRKEFPQKQSLLSRWLPLRKMRRLMIVKRLRQKLLPLWPNRRQRQPLLPLLLPGALPLPAAASLRS